MTKRIRYLTLLMLLLGSIGSWAQDDEPFNPESPGEPGPPKAKSFMLSLVADPAEGGTVNGAGWYDAGASMMLKAYNKENYVFERWVNENDETVSTESQFTYTKQAVNEKLTACFRFSPGNPAEPSQAVMQVYYNTTVWASEGGSVSGGGKYLPGTRIYVSASVNTGYTFDGWYDSKGEKLSSSTGFYFTTLAADESLNARFIFSPPSPDEPVEETVIPKWEVKVSATEGGTVNTGGTLLEEGKTIYLTATANADYVFRGWYVADTLFNSNRSFTYTMKQADIHIVARFAFTPASPGEPSKPATKKYAFYLMNIVAKPATRATYPVYLTSLDAITDMSFQLTFPEQLKPDLSTIALSAKAEGYYVACEALNDTVYTVSLTGGNVPEGNTSLLTFTVPIPEDIQTARNYQVKINLVSVTETDGTIVTASTRNGRISVFKNGDSNGDDVVNVIDVTNTISCILGEPPSEFIIEAADTNDNDGVNVVDVTNIIDIILNGDGKARSSSPAPVMDPQ